jgi:hypothetical protein
VHCRSVRGGATSHKFCSAGRRPAAQCSALVATLLLPKAAATGSQLRLTAAEQGGSSAGSSGRLPTSIRRNRTSLCHTVGHQSGVARLGAAVAAAVGRSGQPYWLLMQKLTRRAKASTAGGRSSWIEPYYAPWCVSGQIKNQNSTKNQRINPTLQFATALSHLSHPTPKIINNINKKSKSQDNPGKYRTLCPLECRQPFCPFWFAAVARGAPFGLLLWRGGLLESVL